MLSTTHRMLDGEQYIDDSTGRRIKRWRHPQYDKQLYHACHINHPCTIWVRQSSSNYEWLYDHFLALCSEYTHRYGKIHATSIKLRNILGKIPKNIPKGGLTQFAMAMPNECKTNDIVESYRTYYQTKQIAFKMKWTDREIPEWFQAM